MTNGKVESKTQNTKQRTGRKSGKTQEKNYTGYFYHNIQRLWDEIEILQAEITNLHNDKQKVA